MTVYPRNRLLGALPQNDYSRISPTLTPIPFPFKQTFHKEGEPIERIIFPSSGVASLVNVMADGRMVEVATVGNEGALGSSVFLGGDIALADSFVQVAGDPETAALSMSSAAFKSEVQRHGAFYDIVGRYSQALQALIMQSAACNVLHSVEERCARWLLMTHDRVTGNDIYLTHEFLGMMLGARRPTVSVVLGTLHKAGLIQNTTKKIVIVDRRGLEAASCECYETVRSTFDRLLPRSRHESSQWTSRVVR